MNRHIADDTMRGRKLSDERGLTLLELLVVMAIIAIVAGFALFGFDSARANLLLTNSARELASHLESARLDSIRRRALPQAANVTFTASNTYTINMDFDGNGTIAVSEARVITLPAGMTVTSPSSFPATITFDWRGRTAGQTITMQNPHSETSGLVVTASGDISSDTTVTAPAANTNLNVNTTVTPTSNINSSL